MKRNIPKPGRIARLKKWIENAGIRIDEFLSGLPADEMIMDASGAIQSPLSLGLARQEAAPAPVAIVRRNPRAPDRSPETSLTNPRAINERALRADRPNNALEKRAQDQMPSVQSFAGKRVSMENPAIMGSGLEAYTQFNRSQYWHQATISSRFNTENFARIDIAELADLLTELSPEVSAALWYYLLCCNSGFEIDVFRPGTDQPHEQGKAYLDECLKKLGSYHGTLNTYFDKTFMAIFMRGSFLYELVLADNGKDFIDIASPDPKTLHFRRKIDPERGQIWDFGQYQNGEFVSLNIPTIRYVPLHPLPGRIEGRAMISPVFFTSIFLMSVLRDLKRVIQQQGHMRLDLEVIFEKLQAAIPTDAKDDPEIFKKWADRVVDEIAQYYGTLLPDDAFVHSDAVKVNKPVGTASADSLNAMDSLFNLLERMAVRALKTLPSLLGLDEASGNQASENRRFEFYQKGNETIQRMVETAFDDECKMILQAKGIQADVKTTFAQLRASEELRDLQVATLKAKLSGFYYDRGWYNQDEAAKMATGKETSDQPEPRTSGSDGLDDGGAIQGAQPDPGAMRFEDISKMLRTPTLSELNQSMEIWKEHAPAVAKDLIDAIPFETGE